MLDRASPAGKPLCELSEITAATDTRDYLRQATKQALAHDDNELIIDVDAHLQEGGFWHEIIRPRAVIVHLGNVDFYRRCREMSVR